jgi:hypothetical protein
MTFQEGEMNSFQNVRNQKGEGMVKALLFLVVLGAAGYAGYVYLWPLVAGADKPAASAPSTVNGGQPMAGSPAAAAVQGSEAAGEVMGSGR